MVYGVQKMTVTSDGKEVYPLWVLAVSVRNVDEGGLEVIFMVD